MKTVRRILRTILQNGRKVKTLKDLTLAPEAIKAIIIKEMFFNEKTKFLIPLHYQQQFIYRINTANKSCISNGSCIVCGCSTPDLMFKPSPCDADCYPRLMRRKEWDEFRKSYLVADEYDKIRVGTA